MATMRSAASSVTKRPAGCYEIKGAEAGVGSFKTAPGQCLRLHPTTGPWSALVLRQRDQVRRLSRPTTRSTRKKVSATSNSTTPDLKAFLTVTGDDQKLGFPGGTHGRSLDRAPISSSPTRGTNTPNYGNQQEQKPRRNHEDDPIEGVDLIVDGGVRNSILAWPFFGAIPRLHRRLPSFSSSYVDFDLVMVDHPAPERQERAVRAACLRPRLGDPRQRCVLQPEP